MSKLNLSLWLISLLLQCGLLLTLTLRRLGTRVPLFTTLIGFYVTRSLLLHFLTTHLRPAPYQLLFTALAVLDVLLQIAVAWEILSAVQRNTSLLRRFTVFALILIAGSLFALLLSASIHANPRAPIDRGVILTSITFLILSVLSLRSSAPGLTRRLSAGFAVFGAFSIAGQIGRTVAAAQRNFTAFNRWSYAGLIVYLLIILAWILLLPLHRERTATAPSLASTPQRGNFTEMSPH